jgi:hypothetical protein
MHHPDDQLLSHSQLLICPTLRFFQNLFFLSKLKVHHLYKHALMRSIYKMQEGTFLLFNIFIMVILKYGKQSLETYQAIAEIMCVFHFNI